MAVNIKLGVDMSSFRSGIQDANAQLKTFDAQLKFAETTFKKTGDAEAAMSTKTEALTKKLATQKNVVKQYEKALEDMKNAGVDPASKSYQQMAAAMLNMQSAANETEIALNGLSASQLTAANTADKLTQSVNGIGKKMSLDQVISGIDKITGALETAGKKAVKLGEEIWNNVMDSARLSDDILTQATVLDMTPEMYQKYKGVFDTIGEITVTEWAAAKRKIEKAMTGPSSDQFDIFRALGFTQIVGGKTENQEVLRLADNWEDAFWQIGEEIQRRVSTGKLSTEMADVYGEAIFGKKYSSLKNLLKGGKEAFLEALGVQNTISDEALEKNAKLNDTVIKLSESFDALKAEVTAGIAPALQGAAEAIDGLLSKLLEYLQKPEGQEMLQHLGEAVSGLFEDLSKIDPQQVVEGFTAVFDKIVGGMQWLWEHKDEVVKALEYIVIGWAGLKLTGGALEIMKLINGVQTFNGIDTGTPQNVTGGDGTILANGTSGGGVWSKLLNGATLFAAANAMYEATEGQIRKVGEEFKKNTAGMSEEEQLKYVFTTDFQMTSEEADEMINKLNTGTSGGHDIPLPVELEPEENAAGKLAEEVGMVVLPAQLHILGGTRGIGTGGENMMRMLGETANAAYSYANGIPFVNDTRLALLHRGERVMTASENRHYTYNSNTYFGSVNLNNGLQVEALAESIARNNRRKNSGYGS